MTAADPATPSATRTSRTVNRVCSTLVTVVRRRTLTAMRDLVVKLTAGAEEPEKCSQAFTVAATAVAAGASVSMWLTGEASWFGVPGRAESFQLEGAAPLQDLLAAVLSAGTVTVCTQCAGRRGLTVDDLVPGVRIAGAAAFVAEATADNAQALVY
jgi:predicted peroxiredoxin